MPKTVQHMAYETIANDGNPNIFVFGDHASKHIPASLDNLGLSGEDLTRHIAWDIGTATVVRALCKAFGCAGQIAGVSRLVIDLNRELDMKSLIPETSDGSVISGNQNLSTKERQRRIDEYYHPYHTAMSKALDQMGFGLAISIHSFTPQLAGEAPRPLEIGLLVKDDTQSANRFKASLEQLKPEWRIGINEPYSAFDLNHTVDANIGSRCLPHVSIEINQDLIGDSRGAEKVGAVLAQALKPIILALGLNPYGELTC